MSKHRGIETKSTAKPKKDKDAPKKGKSAFFYFVDSEVDVVKKKNPNSKHTEVISEISKTWKTLSQREQEPFIQLANKDKERFHKEKAVYNAKKEKMKEESKIKMKSGKREAEHEVEKEPKSTKKIKTVKNLNFK